MPKLIHVVDDDSSFRTAIQRRLLKAGYEVEIAVLPRRAFLLLAHFRPHAMSDLSPLCAPKRTSSGGNARAALAACTDAYACLLLRGNVTVAHGEPLKLRHAGEWLKLYARPTDTRRRHGQLRDRPYPSGVQRHPIVCPGLHDVVRMERQQGRVRWLGGGT
jgi:hypothetical protein